MPYVSLNAREYEHIKTEHNTRTGQVRTWAESYDHQGNVNRVHPKTINGQYLRAQHYPPTGAEKRGFK
ncbi:MAG: hypothetical protein ACRC0B_01870 [Legionella sp.]